MLSVTLAAWAGLISGCIPPPLPPANEILAGLSYAIFQPETSCEELRDDFGLAGLPVANDPGEVGIDFEQVRLPMPDGESLRVWYMPAEDPRGLVIVSPGNTGSMACYLFTVRLLHNAGYSAVLYDYEGFGGSSGVPAIDTTRDNLAAVLDWALAYSGAEHVTLFGMSLGSIPSVAVAIEQPDVVNGLVLDSPVALGTEIERFRRLIRGRSDEVIGVLRQVAPWLLLEDTIEQLDQPLLVYLHGQDLVTPPETVELLYDLAPGPKQLVRFDDLGHAGGQFLRTTEYTYYLETFLADLGVTDP